jgi:hypothetical protein
MADIDHPHATHSHAKGGFEERDVNVYAVTRFGIFLFLGLIVSLFGLWGLLNYFESQVGKLQPASRSLADIDVNRLPPEPRLQPREYDDLKAVRAAENQLLEHYALLDPDRGVVRIPISRALELLAQRGLPSRPQVPAAQNQITATPTEAGLGPVIQQAGGPLAPVIHVPPSQPLEIHGSGDFGDGRQAGGPPTPAEDSPAIVSQVPGAAGEAGSGQQGQKK